MRKVFQNSFCGLVLLFCFAAKAQDSSRIITDTATSFIISDTTVVETVSDEVEKSSLDSNVKAPLVIVRKVPDTTLNKLKSEDDFWYVNTMPNRQKPKAPGKPANLSWLDVLSRLMWWILIGCFIAALIWFLASSNIQLFRRRPSVINALQEEELSENIFEIDYNKEINRVIANQNFAMAIRLYYLQTLLLLSQKGLIQYTHERTNNEYVDQLYKTSYYKDFFRLTRHFEYTWYGQFPISEEAFKLIQTDFNGFKQRIAY